MFPTVHIMMFGWPVISLVIFSQLRLRQAVLASLLAGWLLLPQAGFALSGLPDYTRSTAVILGVVLGIFFFHSGYLFRLRLRWLDLPIIVFCMCPLASSLSNDLGFYDGCSAVLTFTIDFGIPYFLGRLFFSDRIGIRDLATGLVLAMLCYTPLILYELRMSPQLHKHLYGYMQIKFHMIWRLGWYRPMVFLHHGLELGVLLAGAAITAVRLWRCHAAKWIARLPIKVVALTLLAVSLLCRALNGYGVLILGLGALFFASRLTARVVIVSIALIPLFYISGRVMTNWDAAPLVKAVEQIDEERAVSLQSRISHEISLIEKAMQRPFFGWGGWNRNRSEEIMEGARGKRSITDSWWIIIFGQRGIVGLLSLGLVLLRPIMQLAKNLPSAGWSFPENAPATALAMVLLGFTFDCLVNAMVNPIYFVIAGALHAYQPLVLPAKKTAILQNSIIR